MKSLSKFGKYLHKMIAIEGAASGSRPDILFYLAMKGPVIEFFTILGISVALAMDAFAVALATGILLKKVDARQTFRLSWHFGLFQALMPIIGWSLGLTIYNFIESFDHWVAFFLLTTIGTKMIAEAFKKVDNGTTQDPTKGSKMVLLSVATSIDAFAVGLSICMLRVSIWLPAFIIGIVACGFTIAGLHLGKWVGVKSKLGDYAGLVGGIILLGIGFRILYSHGVFS